MPVAWAFVPLLTVAGAAAIPHGCRGTGLALILLGLIARGISARGRRQEAEAPSGPSARVAFALAGIAVAVAAAVRLWHLSTLPEGFWYDEAEAGLEARLTLAEGPSIFARYTDNTALTYWIVAAFLPAVGPTPLAVRLVSAAAGVATTVCCYLAGREAGGRGAGVLAAWFGAVVAWGITFSRLGMPYTVGALFVAASCWLLLRAVRTAAPRDFAAAGLVAGVGQYSYTTFRIFLPAALILTLLLTIRRGRRKGLAKGLMAFWLVAAAAASPLLVAAARDPGRYLGRMAEASVTERRGDLGVAEAVGRNLVAHLGMFHLRGDSNGRHNLPGRPMLEPVAGAGLILGVAALASLEAAPAALLALLLAGGLATGVFSLAFEAPQAARTSQLVPVISILAGVGWWGWYRLRPPGRLARGFGITLLAVASVASGAVNLRWYFVDQASDFASWAAHSPGPTWVARRWNQAGRPGNVLLDPIYRGQRTLEFLAPGMPTERAFDPQRDLPLDPTKGGAFLALSHFDAPYLDVLARLYPCGRREVAMGAPAPPPPGDRGLLELLTFPGQPGPQAIAASIPADVVRGRSGWRIEKGVRASTLVSLPVAGIVETDAPAGVVRIDGQDSRSNSMPTAAGIHVASVPLMSEGAAPPGLRLRPATGPTVPLPPLYAADGLPPGWIASYRPLGEGEAFTRFEWRPDRYVHVLPLPRPYAVAWVGHLAIPATGEYAFHLKVVGEAELRIDDRMVVAADSTGERRGLALLTEGSHLAVLSFRDDRPYSQIFLDWEPPGGRREPLPYGAVVPSR